MPFFSKKQTNKYSHEHLIDFNHFPSFGKNGLSSPYLSWGNSSILIEKK